MTDAGGGAGEPRPTLNIGIRVTSRISGGGQVFIERIVDALARHPSAPKITLFYIGDLPKAWWSAAVSAVSVTPTTTPARERLLAGRSLRRAVSNAPVDVLLCPGTGVPSLPETPVIIWPLTVAPFEDATVKILGISPLARLRLRLLRHLIVRACSRVDAAVFSSAYARDLHLVNVPQLRNIPTAVVYPAASLDMESTFDRSAQRVIHEPGPLLFVSHLYPYKMVKELIEGYALTRTAGHLDAPLLIAGAAVDQAYFRMLTSTVKRCHVDQDVKFLGNLGRDDLGVLYRQARAFIFPSISENAGSYALIDAFAYGVPILSSSRSSMPEIVGDAALTFDPTSPKDLADKLIQFETVPGLAERLRRQSAERINFFPTWDDIATEFIDLVIATLKPPTATQHPTSPERTAP